MRDKNMRYEFFLRKAFGNIDRMGDPAKIADADFFVENNLVEIKIAIGYAISIYINNDSFSLENDSIEELIEIRKSLLSSKNLDEVYELLCKSINIVN